MHFEEWPTDQKKEVYFKNEEEDGFDKIDNLYFYENLSISDTISILNNDLGNFEAKTKIFLNMADLIIDLYDKPLDNIEKIISILGNPAIDTIGEIKKDIKRLISIDDSIKINLNRLNGLRKSDINYEDAYNTLFRKYLNIINTLAVKLHNNKLYEQADCNFSLPLQVWENNITDEIFKIFDNFVNYLIFNIDGEGAKALFSRYKDSNGKNIFSLLHYNRIKNGVFYLNDVTDNEKIQAFLSILLGNNISADQDPEEYKELITQQNIGLNLLIHNSFLEAKKLVNIIGYETPGIYDLSTLLTPNMCNQIKSTAHLCYDIVNLANMKNVENLGDNSNIFSFFHYFATFLDIIQAIDFSQSGEMDEDSINIVMNAANSKYKAALYGDDEFKSVEPFLISEGISPEGSLDKSKAKKT